MAAENEFMTKGVDLRLRCITSSPSQTLRRRLVRTTATDAAVSARLDAVIYFAHFATRTVYNTVDLYAVYAAIFVQNRVFCLPHLHSTPPLEGFPSKYRHPVWHGKNRMAWLPDGEKISKISLLVLMQHERDRRTDTA